MSIVWTASIEAYQRVIAEKKHMREELETELASPITNSRGDFWYIKNELLNINRQIEGLEEWLKKLEEKGEGDGIS